MKPLPTLAALILSTWAATCQADAEVIGTAYSVIYRGPTTSIGAARSATPAYAQPRYPARPQPGVPALREGALRLINGRTGQEIARAGFDPQLKGWLFALPMNLAAAGPVCLVFKNAAGASLALRDEKPGDDGYAFRNPLWEDELSRAGELVELRAELGKLDAQLATERDEQQRLQAEVREAGATTPGTCPLPPAPPDPARPAGALDTADAQAQAAGICALKWEQLFAEAGKVDSARFFADAGLSGDWAGREAARGAAGGFADQPLPGTRGEHRLIVEAAAKGKTFLEHAEGVRMFSRHQATCRSQIERSAEATLKRWDEARLAQRQAPQRLQQQCEAKLARIEQIRTQHTKAPAYRAELERRLGQLDRGSASATKSASLEDKACREF